MQFPVINYNITSSYEEKDEIQGHKLGRVLYSVSTNQGLERNTSFSFRSQMSVCLYCCLLYVCYSDNRDPLSVTVCSLSAKNYTSRVSSAIVSYMPGWTANSSHYQWP